MINPTANVLIGLLLLAGCTSMIHAQADDKSTLGQVEQFCRYYESTYFSSKTNLAYARRINGPQGASVLEKIEEIKAGRVAGQDRPWGYGAGLEDVAYKNGILLFALCDAYEATGHEYFAHLARRTLKGLLFMSTVSPTPGFVPRGPHPNDYQAYYKDSSIDQHTLYLVGLWRYHRSSLATAEDRKSIAKVVHDVVARMEANQWVIKAEDNTTDAHAGGNLLKLDQPTLVVGLFLMLTVAHDVTGDAHWKEIYEKFGTEADGRRWLSLTQDPNQKWVPRYNIFNNQDMFRTEVIRRIETDPQRKDILQQRIGRWASDMITGPSLRLWRSSFSSDKKASADEVQQSNLRYLEQFGVTVRPEANVNEVFEQFSFERITKDLSKQSHRYVEMGLTVPTMVWHIAFLSQQPDSMQPAIKGVDELVTRIKPDQIGSSWTINYSVVAGLLRVAAGQTSVQTTMESQTTNP